MKQRIVCQRPLIIVRDRTKYSHVSMDAGFDGTRWEHAWHPITEEGDEILEKYLDTLVPYIKTHTLYGAGQYISVTVRKELVPSVIETFKTVYQQHHRTITHLDIVRSAMTGEVL